MKAMFIAATVGDEEKEEIIGLGQYGIDDKTHTAEVAFAIRDQYQGQGIGTEMLSYLTYLARRHGLLGFIAEVLIENKPMLRVFEKMGFDMKKSIGSGVYELHMTFL
jgi:RimJ/RimL family protein N-acetyltransferase